MTGHCEHGNIIELISVEKNIVIQSTFVNGALNNSYFADAAWWTTAAIQQVMFDATMKIVRVLQSRDLLKKVLIMCKDMVILIYRLARLVAFCHFSWNKQRIFWNYIKWKEINL